MKAGDALDAMARLPLAELDRIAPGTVLIVAPHPDDETLGCGGLIAALSDAGRPPVIACVTDGAASHPGSEAYPPAKLAKLRQQELRDACAILGVSVDRVHFLDLPDSAAPAAGAEADRAAETLASIARSSGAAALFTAWGHDPHCDHEASAQIARSAASRAGVPLLFYPVWGWLLPRDHELGAVVIDGMRFDMASFLPRKRAAIAAHASQYTDLITDSPDGFRLPADLLAIFDRPFEVFLTA